MQGKPDSPWGQRTDLGISGLWGVRAVGQSVEGQM